MQIWANTIVNNEENFIWFSIMSIVDYVDKVMIFDTGSTDNTVNIIQEMIKIKGEKMIFKEVGTVSYEEFPKVRQKMLDESNCDWILILDGDEIWWKDSIKRAVKEIKKNGGNIDGIVVPIIVPVGDIYHLQEEKAGRYNLLGRVGHFSLRLINRKIPGLHVDYPYGKESYIDGENRLVQERERIIFLDAPYLHVTHLKRSSKDRGFNKFKFELGNIIPDNFKYPEILYDHFPKFIPSPWQRLSGTKFLKAKLLTPFRKIKRRLVR